jgi:hypothetical protein
MAITNIKGTPVNATATNGTSAVATITGIPGSTMYITDIAGSSDKAGSLLLVKQGTTTIWQVQLATTAAGINAFSERFTSPLAAVAGADISVTVDGTTLCKANIAGYYL